MTETTAVNWTAYRLIHKMNCEPDEIIGYYARRHAAEEVRQNYIFSKGLKEETPCCNCSKNVVIEEIFIQS